MGTTELAEAVHRDTYIESMMRIEDSEHDNDVESQNSLGGLDTFLRGAIFSFDSF